MMRENHLMGPFRDLRLRPDRVEGGGAPLPVFL